MMFIKIFIQKYQTITSTGANCSYCAEWKLIVSIFILEFIRSVVNMDITERIDSFISVFDNKQRLYSFDPVSNLQMYFLYVTHFTKRIQNYYIRLEKNDLLDLQNI